MSIPDYPHFAPVDLTMRESLHPRLAMLKEGISEFTFAGIYLFRNTYSYRVSSLPGGRLCISGQKDGKRFFMLPAGLPEKEIFEEIFAGHDFVKGLPETSATDDRISLEQWGFRVVEDRNNFDYLYDRKDLAHLPGKKYHKKRNLVNAFLNNYTYEEKPLSDELLPDAFRVLELWQESKTEPTDYRAAKEALELRDELDLKGNMYYVDGEPAGYTLGEPLAHGTSFAIHFEKALGGFKGIYQFINMSFAAALPRHYKWINREQDLGDEGLRQAKMTYRPCGFVRKYQVWREGTEES